MMNSIDLIIVDPRFALQSRDILEFKAEFGPFSGRYVPRFPTNWSAWLIDHLKDLDLKQLGPVRRQAILETIRRDLPHCTETVSWKWDTKLSWNENLENLNIQKDKALIIGFALDPSPHKEWAEAVEQIRENRRRSWSFNGTISEYVKSCRPLLKNSPVSFLIDPYLDPLSQTGELLIKTLFYEMSGSRCYSLEIITRRISIDSEKSNVKGKPLRNEEIERELFDKYRFTIPNKRMLKVHVLDDNRITNRTFRFHDRFFLTAYGSINFGQGFFVTDNGATRQNAFVLDKAHHQDLKELYMNQIGKYNSNATAERNNELDQRIFTISIERDINN